MVWYQGPDLPKCCCRNSNDCRLRSAPVKMPSRFILSAVTGPTPWNLPTGNASTNAAPIAGVTTNWPLGLRWSEASLARNLLYEIPADAVRPVSSKMRARISAAVADAVGMPRRFSVTSRLGLVERERLDEGPVIGEDRANFTRHCPIDLGPWRHAYHVL